MGSLQDMAVCTGIPRGRIDRLAAGQTLPAWDEAQALAWHFKEPLSRLIQPLQRVTAASLGHGARTRPRTTPYANARRTLSLQGLAAAHPHIFDVTLAQWPAWLAPGLPECLATEAVILRVHAEWLGEDTRGALAATAGVQNRLRSLTIRHRLRLQAPHSIGMHSLARALHDVLSALTHHDEPPMLSYAIGVLNNLTSALDAELLVR
jgi:hypothetical protein